MRLVYQNSFIAFLASDPVGLRRDINSSSGSKKPGSDSIWQDGLGQDGTILAKQTHRPVRSHPRERGQKNFMIRESLTKVRWIKILETSLKIQNISFSFLWQQIYCSNLPVTMYSGFVEPTYRGFATVGSYGFVCDQTSLAGVGQVEGAMVRKILEINSLCGNQSGFLPFGKSGSSTINRGLLPSNEAAPASWPNSKDFLQFPRTNADHSFTIQDILSSWGEERIRGQHISKYWLGPTWKGI